MDQPANTPQRSISGVVRRMSTLGSRRPSVQNGPIVQSLRRASSWLLGRRDSSVPVDVPSKRISDGSLPPVEQVDLSPKILVSVRCGGASLRGYRHKVNEDTLCIEANLIPAKDSGDESVGFAAVFDGHAGPGCSSHLQTAVSAELKRLLSEESPSVTTDGTSWKRLGRNALLNTFENVDKDFLRLARMSGDVSGSCAVACLVKGSTIIIAHVGDSAVICINRNGGQVNRLTKDHDARNSYEVRRVSDAGGQLINDRLNGKLQPLRAFGDKELKSKGLTAVPDIVEQQVDSNMCVLLCSDGITAKLTDDEIASFIQNALLEDDDPARVSSALVTYVSKVKRGLDDASAVILLFDELH